MTEEEFMGRPIVKKEKNGARKFDNEKAPVTTGFLWRFPRAIEEVSKVSAVGAEKYEVTLPDDNFLKVDNGFNRYADANGRHLIQRGKEVWNTETGGALPPGGRKVRHLAQNAWDAMTILELELLAEEEAAKTVSPTNSPTEGYPGQIVWIPESPTIHPHPLPSPDNQLRLPSIGGYIDPKQSE